MTEPKHWPRRNPFDKKWFQRQIAWQLTIGRHTRLQRIIRKWEPRLWDKGLNLPDRLLAEYRRLSILVTDNKCDWTAFPEWVTKGQEDK